MVDKKQELELDYEQWRNTFMQAIKNAKQAQKWRKKAKLAMSVYRCDREDELSTYHANLATAVQVQQGAIITQVPEIVCSGENELSYADDMFAQAAEKILKHYVDEGDLGGEVDKFTASVFAASNGSIRINDDLTFSMVNHENMLCEPCASFDQCDWVAFCHNVGRGVFVDEYGEPNVEGYEKMQTLKVWEIWDKANQKVWWISEAKEEILECNPPRVNFDGFYPIPKPVYLDCLTESFEPTIEYEKWRHLDEQVQKIAGREKIIIDAIKAGYFYDQHAFGDLSKIEFTEDDQGIPVDGSMYQNGGQFDINKTLQFYNNEQYIQVLTILGAQREALQMKIDKTIGLSNEMQSMSTPNETATSQRIKHGYGSNRLELKRRAIHRLIRDAIRLLAQAVVELVDVSELSAIAGKNLPEIVEANVTQGLIAYDIDIETQTSIAINEKDERADKLEFLQTFATVAERFTPLIDSGKMDMETLAELMKMVTSSFPSSRSIDDNIDKLPQLHNTVQQLNQQLQQLNQQIMEQGQQLQGFEQENMALKQQLASSTQVDMQKKVAETQKTMVETELKQAEIQHKDIETVQKANEVEVAANAMVDERLALQYQMPNVYPPGQ